MTALSNLASLDFKSVNSELTPTRANSGRNNTNGSFDETIRQRISCKLIQGDIIFFALPLHTLAMKLELILLAG